jgi:hypothetical protein
LLIYVTAQPTFCTHYISSMRAFLLWKLQVGSVLMERELKA